MLRRSGLRDADEVARRVAERAVARALGLRTAAVRLGQDDVDLLPRSTDGDPTEAAGRDIVGHLEGLRVLAVHEVARPAEMREVGHLLRCHADDFLVDHRLGSVPIPVSRTSSPWEIVVARSPPWKYHWVWAAWTTPWVAAASIV